MPAKRANFGITFAAEWPQFLKLGNDSTIVLLDLVSSLVLCRTVIIKLLYDSSCTVLIYEWCQEDSVFSIIFRGIRRTASAVEK